MRVTPDGKANPFIRPVEADANPIYITVRRRADDVWDPPGPRPNWVDSEYTKMDSRYVVVFQMGSSQNSPPFQTNPDGHIMDFDVSGADRYSDMNPKFPHTYPFNLDVTAIYWGAFGYNMLILKPAEKDWVFVVYTGSLRTDTEARRMNIRLPHPPGYQSEAEVEISLLTGPCIRETR
jgi:hypothetical protein